MTTDEQRAEDALAQRWDRLLAQKASLPNKLLNEYHQLFAAAEMEVDDGHLAVCVAVSEFFETTRRLPKRQVGDSDEKRAEDALAQRWDRLMAEKASVSKDLLSHYSAIFGAAEMEVDDAPRAVCIAVHVFFWRHSDCQGGSMSLLIRIERKIFLLGAGIEWFRVNQQSVWI